MGGRAATRVVSVACLLLLLVSCNHVQPHLKIPDLRISEPALRATLVGYTGARWSAATGSKSS